MKKKTAINLFLNIYTYTHTKKKQRQSANSEKKKLSRKTHLTFSQVDTVAKKKIFHL